MVELEPAKKQTLPSTPKVTRGAGGSGLGGAEMADYLLPLIERHQINSFFAPPTIWISLSRSPLFDMTNLSSLRKAPYAWPQPRAACDPPNRRTDCGIGRRPGFTLLLGPASFSTKPP